MILNTRTVRVMSRVSRRFQLWRRRRYLFRSASLIFWTALIVCLILTGCTLADLNLPHDESNPISGSTWRLLAYGDPENPTLAPVEDSIILFEVNPSSSRLIAKSDCNTFEADYRMSGAELEVSAFQPLGSACTDEYDAQTQAFLAIFEQAQSQYVQADALRIVGGERFLLFETASSASGNVSVRIISPRDQSTVHAPGQIWFTGYARGLFEGNVALNVRDPDSGNTIVTTFALAEGPDVGLGGPAIWRVSLGIDSEFPDHVTLVAFSPSPVEGSAAAEDSVDLIVRQSS